VGQQEGIGYTGGYYLGVNWGGHGESKWVAERKGRRKAGSFVRSSVRPSLSDVVISRRIVPSPAASAVAK